MMRHLRRQNPARADVGTLARYAHDLQQARRLLDAQIRRGDVTAVHVRSWLFGTDPLTQERAA